MPKNGARKNATVARAAPMTAPTPNIRCTSPSPIATRPKPSVPRMRVIQTTNPPTSAPSTAPSSPLTQS